MPQGKDWWLASDGKWYPPHLHPDAEGTNRAVRGDPPPGWWLASDGRWYPPDLHPEAEMRKPLPTGLVRTAPAARQDRDGKRRADVDPGQAYEFAKAIRSTREPGGWRSSVGAPDPSSAVPLVHEPEDFFTHGKGAEEAREAAKHAARQLQSPKPPVSTGLSRSQAQAATSGSKRLPKPSPPPPKPPPASPMSRLGEWLLVLFVVLIIIGAVVVLVASR